jgi:hypothetical protein
MTDGSASEKKEVRRYEADELMEHSLAYFGEPPYVVAAALESAERKTHTMDQAKELVRKIKRHEVEPFEGTPQEEEILAAREAEEAAA